jgi:dihydrofolate reductase/thymidylate synthase
MSRKINVPISCVLVTDSANGISKNGVIPWKITEDLKYFKKVTSPLNSGDKSVIIMGRNTWDTIPSTIKPLKDRINVVISTTLTEDFTNSNLIFCHDVDKVISYFNNLQEKNNVYSQLFIIGGKKLYDQFLNSPNVKCVYLTKIKKDYDTDLKVNFIEDNFELLEENKQNVTDANTGEQVDISFNIYLRKDNLEELRYLNTLKKIITTGNFRKTRNANTYSCFGSSLTFDLSQSFPLLTTKKMFLRGIFEELKFFLLGQTDTKILEEKRVNIWKENTTRKFLDLIGLTHLREGDMGPMYGFQLKHFGAEYTGCDSDYTGKGYDQLQTVINLLKTDKYSRRIMMTTFHPVQSFESCLFSCHGIVIQFGIDGTNKLCCHMYQRSADEFLGVPFNIASYALIVHIICELVNNDPDYTGEKFQLGTLTMAFGDYHVYESHVDQINEQCNRIPYPFPQLKINKKITKIEDLNFEDLEIINYRCYPSIKADMVA